MILAHMTTNTNLLVISVARVAGDCEVLQQVNAVVFIVSTHSSFQKSLPVIVIPATHKETEASNQDILNPHTLYIKQLRYCEAGRTL